MDIEKRYRRLEDTMEIRIKNITEEELFHLVDPIYETPKIPFKSVLKNLPCDMDVFIPYKGGQDFVVQTLGVSALERGNVREEDVEGRLLSECCKIIQR